MQGAELVGSGGARIALDPEFAVNEVALCAPSFIMNLELNEWRCGPRAAF
jgi:hypothetical protein